jgi:iron complex transport system substrate-binding protein
MYSTKRNLSILLFLLLSVVLVFGGGSPEPEKQKPAVEETQTKEKQGQTTETGSSITIEDSLGKMHTLKKPIERIIVVNRQTSEAIKLLGVDNLVVATGDSTVKYNPYLGFGDRPDVGKGDALNIELILSLKPNILFTHTNRNMGIEDQLEPAGISVFRIDNYQPDMLDKELMILAKIFDRENRAKEFLDWKNKTEGMLTERVSEIPEDKKKVVMAVSVGFMNAKGGYRIFPSKTKGGRPGVGEGYATVLAGGKPACPELEYDPKEGGTTILVEEEFALSKGPEVITMHGTWLGGYKEEDTSRFEDVLENILNISSVTKTPAGRSNELYIFHTDMLGANKRFIGVMQLAKYLYPERFDDVDPIGYAKEYFNEYIGVPFKGVWWYSAKE